MHVQCIVHACAYNSPFKSDILEMQGNMDIRLLIMMKINNTFTQIHTHTKRVLYTCECREMKK